MRWAAVLAAGAIAVAACSTGADVESTRSDSSSAPSSVEGRDSGTAADGAQAPTPPDPTGLPELGGIADGTITGTLDNGLRYFVRENDNPGGSAELRLVIDAGSALERDDQLGGAHFLEHMLFNGTERFPENELIAVLRSFGAAFGADINAYTSFDETVYELNVPTDDDEMLNTALDVLADWLTAATIDPAQVEAERGVVLDEWRRDSGVDGRIFDGVEALFLAGSPYADRRPIGTRASIESLTAEQLRRFYDDWYRPDLATVIVVGSIDASTVRDGIVERFGEVTARGTSPERPELVVQPVREPQAEVVVDDDVARPLTFVTLPTAPTSPGAPGSAGSDEAVRQREILEALAFDAIATRLQADALDGIAPFDDASVDSSGFVRGMSAPEIVVVADPEQLRDAVTAVLVEYARVARDGFTTGEIERAIERYRASVDTAYAGRDSKQDAAYAEEYVRFVLEDAPAPSVSADRELSVEILDRTTAAQVAWAFNSRYSNTAPHMFIATAATDEADVPTAPELVEIAFEVMAGDVEPRTERTASSGELLAPSDGVQESDRQLLADGLTNSFVRPTVLTFPNGARVSLNRTPIVEGVVVFEAASPGGYALVADDDLADAKALDTVVAESGVGDLNRADLDALLAGDDLQFGVYMSRFLEGMQGSVSTADLETLFALIHTQLVAPRVDGTAVERFVREQRPLVEDPGLDPGYANFQAVLEARYSDPEALLLSAAELETVDAAGIERVFTARFGDVSDWAFAFSGDIDIDAAVELSRRYIGTLPGEDVDDQVDFFEGAPPDGVVRSEVSAASGDLAIYTLLFTGPASTERRDDVLADAIGEVLTTRLTDVVREQLGQSYSPFGVVQLTDGGRPLAETYISVTTGPDLLDEVVATITGELDRLRTDGPTDEELAGVFATLGEQYDLFSNEQINDEVLSVLVDPAGHPDIDDFLTQQQDLDALRSDPDLVEEAMRNWLPEDQFVEVTVRPR